MNLLGHCASATSRMLAALNQNMAHSFAIWYGKKTIQHPNYCAPITWERLVRTADGMLMRVQFQESLGRTLIFGKVHEPELVKKIKENLHSGDVFVDVGANQGYFTILASKIVGEQGRVLAFEPSTPNLARLTANLSLNKCNNVLLFSEALSDGCEVGKLSLPWAINSGVCSLGNGPSSRGETAFDKGYTLTAMRPFDEILAAIKMTQDIAVIKIDAEGHEAQVLHGMKRALAQSKDVKISCELSPTSYAVDELLQYMQSLGFRGEFYKHGVWNHMDPSHPPMQLCNAWFWKE